MVINTHIAPLNLLYININYYISSVVLATLAHYKGLVSRIRDNAMCSLVVSILQVMISDTFENSLTTIAYNDAQYACVCFQNFDTSNLVVSISLIIL